MPKVALHAGAEIDILSPGELREELARDFTLREVARLRGIKHLEIPQFLIGKASGSAISLGVDKGNPAVGPLSGFIWSIQALVVTGLQSGATPDIVNIYKNTTTTGGPIFWSFDGNHFGATFGRLQRTMKGGDTLTLVNSGTFNSTSQIILSGEVLEIPAELVGKLA